MSLLDPTRKFHYHDIYNNIDEVRNNFRTNGHTIGLKSDLLDDVPKERVNFVLAMNYAQFLLPTLSDADKEALVHELLSAKIWVKDAKKDDDIQRDNQRLDELFAFFKTHNLTPSDDEYYKYWWTLSHHNDPTHLFDHLWSMGVHLSDQNDKVTQVWALFMSRTEKREVKGAQWLANKSLFPKVQGPFPTRVEDTPTVFHWVKNKTSLEILKLIPSERLKVVKDHTDKAGQTPMHYAVRQLLPDFVKLLVDLGANKNPQDNKGRYPLDLIKRTTSRVEHIGAIQDLLDAKSNKTPEQVLEHALKTVDPSLLDRALQDPNIKSKASNVMVDVLQVLIGNSSPTVFNKQKKRQKEMFDLLVDHVDIEHIHDGNNYLHYAVSNGALDIINELLVRAPHLAQMHNTHNKRPADVNVEHFDKMLQYKYDTYKSYSEYNDLLRLDTSKKIFKLFKKHNIAMHEGNFPRFKQDTEAQALFTNYLLKQHVDMEKGAAGAKKKM